MKGCVIFMILSFFFNYGTFWPEEYLEDVVAVLGGTHYNCLWTIPDSGSWDSCKQIAVNHLACTPGDDFTNPLFITVYNSTIVFF